MKITYMGRRTSGRFDSIGARIKRFAWKSGKVLGMAGIVFWGGVWMAQAGNEIQYQTKEVPVDVMPQKIEALKTDLVSRLSDCERAGKTEDDGIVTYDNNKAGTLRGEDVFSYGVMQFKVKTVKGFVKLRDSKVITTKEAIELALDADEARSLAQYAIFEQGAISHWLNCANKLGLSNEVKLINKLSN